MTMVVLAVCERVHLAMGAVSIVLCTLGGDRSVEGKRDRIGRAIGSSGLVVGVGGIGMSRDFVMTTLGSGTGDRYSQGRRIGRRIERGRA